MKSTIYELVSESRCLLCLFKCGHKKGTGFPMLTKSSSCGPGSLNDANCWLTFVNKIFPFLPLSVSALCHLQITSPRESHPCTEIWWQITGIQQHHLSHCEKGNRGKIYLNPFKWSNVSFASSGDLTTEAEIFLLKFGGEKVVKHDEFNHVYLNNSGFILPTSKSYHSIVFKMPHKRLFVLLSVN